MKGFGKSSLCQPCTVIIRNRNKKVEHETQYCRNCGKQLKGTGGTGLCGPCVNKRNGKQNANWTGDYATPGAQVKRCKRIRGVAQDLPCLGVTGRCKGTAYEWAHVHGRSGLDVYKDFLPLCQPCHRYYDDSANNLPKDGRGMRGKSHSDESRAKMSETKQRPEVRTRIIESQKARRERENNERSD